jgi:aerobic-type carbon monoxide dehydrogenase small subunit (CoxS/CutS family)
MNVSSFSKGVMMSMSNSTFVKQQGSVSETEKDQQATKKASKSKISIKVNSKWYDFEVDRDIRPSDTLAYLLREKLALTGLKVACDEGACGACTVLMDGEPVLSCMTLALEAEGHEILTVEGLEKDDPVVEAFAEQSEPGYGTAMQCGYCTPGFVMAAKGLLFEHSKPTLDQIKEGLSGNLCRCGCYPAIARAVQQAARKLNQERSRDK